MKIKKVKKAVFPVAGLGTRFLPATKASPKEMMPVVDRPLIQYAVEEAVNVGIETLVFVNGRSKRAIEDHFDTIPELEYELERRGKSEILKLVRGIVPKSVSCVYVRQSTPRGLGDAVLCAQPVLGDEPFIVLLADDLIDPVRDSGRCIAALIEGYEKFDGHMIIAEEVKKEEVRKYGIMGVTKEDGKFWRVKELVEKPEPENAPGNLAIMGRYLFKPSIFTSLKKVGIGVGGELQLTDAIAREIDRDNVLAFIHQGKRYDCGTKLGYLQANVEVGMQDPEVGKAFTDYLKSLREIKPDQ